MVVELLQPTAARFILLDIFEDTCPTKTISIYVFGDQNRYFKPNRDAFLTLSVFLCINQTRA